jgi:hypothetical protein
MEHNVKVRLAVSMQLNGELEAEITEGDVNDARVTMQPGTISLEPVHQRWHLRADLPDGAQKPDWMSDEEFLTTMSRVAAVKILAVMLENAKNTVRNDPQAVHVPDVAKGGGWGGPEGGAKA